MSAFFLFDNLQVHDAGKLATYADHVAPIVAGYGGRYRAIGGAPETVEGDWALTYPVIIEFDTLEKAKAWYASKEYEPWKTLRQQAVTCNGVLIDGTSGQDALPVHRDTLRNPDEPA